VLIPQELITVQTLGHTGFIRVDGVVYEWLGGQEGLKTPALTGLTLTPTSTRFSAQAAGMDINITFLSPLEVPTLIPNLILSIKSDFRSVAGRYGSPILPIYLHIR
jgi:hypothetical protein